MSDISLNEYLTFNIRYFAVESKNIKAKLNHERELTLLDKNKVLRINDGTYFDFEIGKT